MRSSLSRKVADELVGATSGAIGEMWTAAGKDAARSRYFEDMLAVDEQESAVGHIGPATPPKQWLPNSFAV